MYAAKMFGAGALLTTLASALVIFVYLLFFEPPWLSYRNLPFPVTLEQVHAGGVAPLTVVRCSNAKTKRNYAVSHTLRNMDTGELLVLPGVIAQIDPGCTRDTSFINRVPKTAKPGRYRAEGTAEVARTIPIGHPFFVDWYSEPFEVIDP